MSVLGIASAVALLSVGEACQDAINRGQQPGNACSYEHAQLIEAELNRVWQQASPDFRKQAENWERNYSNPGFYEIILEEQRAWIRYREAVCAHKRFKFYDGSAAPWIYNECMVDMAIERIAYLLNLAGKGEE